MKTESTNDRENITPNGSKDASSPTDKKSDLHAQTASSLKDVFESTRKAYKIELITGWPLDLSSEVRLRVESVVAWEEPHLPEWYHTPGRTLVLPVNSFDIKIKGAGLYNPGNVSHAGSRRTITPIPENPVPIPPMQRLFERDLTHVDPSATWPHIFKSDRSTSAPIGGMVVETALNDQKVFSRLAAAGIPANRPLAVYQYKDLSIDGKPMAVSISLLPSGALAGNAYKLFYVWNSSGITKRELKFIQEYSGRGINFSYENPEHRLEVLAKLARVAGKLLFDFSTKAGIYRFSGGPDNWNIKFDHDEPLYFSDVDTARHLEEIPRAQHGWEVIRNLISALHNWIYYFMPVITHEQSGYTPELLQQIDCDVVKAMLSGFFEYGDAEEIQKASQSIWKFLQVPLQAATKEKNAGLRTGENFLQRFFSRPQFYLTVLGILSKLIQGSKFQKAFPDTDTSPAGIQRYIDLSSEHDSHAQLFRDYSPSDTRALIAKILSDNK